MTTLEIPWAALDTPASWYRLPSVKVALGVSLVLHALAFVLLPGLRVPEPNLPVPLTVELAPPPPVPKVETPPPPVVKPIQKPVPPPRPEIKPLPKSEPPPVVEKQAPPPPQPVVVPPRPAQAEPQVTAPPRVEVPVLPPPQAEAPPPAPKVPTLDTSLLREYGAVVSNAVAKKKVYPRLALMRHWQGTTDLKLQIAADGGMKALSVARSSGFDVLDEQAMKMVKDAMPLPNLPDALRGREFAIDIPVAFKLQD